MERQPGAASSGGSTPAARVPTRAGTAYRAPLPPRYEAPKRPFSWQAIAIVVFVVDLVVCGFLWVHRVTGVGPVGVGLFLIPLLVLLTLPVFARASKETTTWDLAGLMALGLGLRFLACFYRFDNAADGGVYTQYGKILAGHYRHLDFSVATGGSFPGTGGMRFITGVVAALTNSNAFAEFLVFTWLSFLGCCLLYRAFATALPGADHRRYALLIFLWPTLVFWPSSAGKDCWMLFTLGLGALGAARVLTRRSGGYLLLLLGLGLGSLVRPHIALIELAAFAFALLVGRRTSTINRATPASVAKIAGLVLLLVVGGFLLNRTANLLASNDINGVDAALSTNSTRTAQGGSQFSPSNPKQPVGYAIAAVTILFRPFPFEAHQLDQLVVALEALFLAVLLAVSWRRLLSIPGRLRSQPYVTMAVVYIALFVFALGTVSNFGILARERSQLMPFVFVLLCVPPLGEVRRAPAAGRAGSASVAPTGPVVRGVNRGRPAPR